MPPPRAPSSLKPSDLRHILTTYFSTPRANRNGRRRRFGGLPPPASRLRGVQVRRFATQPALPELLVRPSPARRVLPSRKSQTIRTPQPFPEGVPALFLTPDPLFDRTTQVLLLRPEGAVQGLGYSLRRQVGCRQVGPDAHPHSDVEGSSARGSAHAPLPSRRSGEQSRRASPGGCGGSRSRAGGSGPRAPLP
jgi:hypothetical protein